MAENDDEQFGPTGGGGIPGALAALALWWVLCAALWLVLVDNLHWAELVTGAVVAMLGAIAAVLVRSERAVVMRPSPLWLVKLVKPVALYPRDLALATRVLLRALLAPRNPPRGRLFAVPFEPGGDDPRSAARRVLMVSAASFAPNTFVVGGDDEAGVLLVHQLVPRDDPAADADPLGLRG